MLAALEAGKQMNENYKYPPDTSWLPRRWWRRRDLAWGLASMALSVAPFALWIVIGFEEDAGIGYACWPVGLILGF